MDLLFNLEPTAWSRNFDDEEIEELEFQAPKPIEFKLMEGVETPLSGATLLVAAKPAAACFLHAQFPSKTRLASIVIPEIESKKKSSSTSAQPNMNDKVCEIFRDDNDSSTLLLVCHYDVPVERANDLTRVLLSNVSTNDIFVFDTLLDWKFNATAAERATLPMLRKLETDSTRAKAITSDCAYLESPNLVDSFGAALIVRRQMQKQQCCLYVSLESSRLLDVDTLLAFEVGLKRALPNKDLAAATTTPLYKKLLASIVSRRPNPLFL